MYKYTDRQTRSPIYFLHPTGHSKPRRHANFSCRSTCGVTLTQVIQKELISRSLTSTGTCHFTTADLLEKVSTTGVLLARLPYTSSFLPFYKKANPRPPYCGAVLQRVNRGGGGGKGNLTIPLIKTLSNQPIPLSK